MVFNPLTFSPLSILLYIYINILSVKRNSIFISSKIGSINSHKTFKNTNYYLITNIINIGITFNISKISRVNCYYNIIINIKIIRIMDCKYLVLLQKYAEQCNMEHKSINEVYNYVKEQAEIQNLTVEEHLDLYEQYLIQQEENRECNL